MVDLTVVHLYPDLLHTYGDRGNVMALRRRAERRGRSVAVVSVSKGEALPAHADLIFIGGGSDRVQRAIGADLVGRRGEIADLVAAGSVVVGVCGGYQLFGGSYRLPDGSSIEGLGILDVVTEAGDDRIVGRVAARVSRADLSTQLLGFENHGGRTRIGPGAAPLARVMHGGGNNGVDRTEGAVQGRVVGTYLHGPVLVLNPELTDWLLGLALGDSGLPSLEDQGERQVRTAWLERVRRCRRPRRRH